MYVPPVYKPRALDEQHRLIERHPFGVMTTTGHDRCKAVHLPFVLDRQLGRHGTLRGHIAAANDIKADLEAGVEVLVVFSGPDSYVSPYWYSQGLHFPTWIYSSVHVYGRPRPLDAAGLEQLLRDLIARGEADVGSADPWTLERAPRAMVESLMTRVVGFELPIEVMEGCFKLNQHKDEVDSVRLATVLESQGGEMRAELAALMREHRPSDDAAAETARKHSEAFFR